MQESNSGGLKIGASPRVAPESKVSQLPEILDGKWAEDLAGSARNFEFASGDRVIAGTDKGINYINRNEDRVVISPDANFVAVVDGMGGFENGEISAQILAEHLLQLPTDIQRAVQEAAIVMDRQGIGKGGAVFISARLRRVESGGKFLDIFQSGDSKLMIIKEGGKVGFESVDDSSVQKLVDGLKITADQALYHPKRHEVVRSIGIPDDTQPQQLKSYLEQKVETGDVVLLMSDGVSDAFTSEEIAKKVKEGLSSDGLFSWLSDETDKRMLNKDKIVRKPNADGTESGEQKDILEKRIKIGHYSDGYKSKPKPDNRALVILEIK